MQDQVAALRLLGIRANFLNSTLNPEEVYAIESSLRNDELDLLYIAPERLNRQCHSEPLICCGPYPLACLRLMKLTAFRNGVMTFGLII